MLEYKLKSNDRKRTLRKILLKKLLKLIESGKFNNNHMFSGSLSNKLGPRKTYYSSLDRSGYNYGYMTFSEYGL